MAGLNEWMNGCMSVVLRSCFSYQVAAGSTMSEKIVVLVWRKSRVSSRSSFPSGASSCQSTSCGRWASPASVARKRAVGAEQVLEEVLVALARRAQQVRAPDRQDAREVLRRVRVLGGEAQVAALQLLDDVLGDRPPGRRGLVGQVERVAVEGRVGGHPAHPGALGDDVGRAQPGQPAGAGGGRDGVGAEGVVAELVGVEVPVGGVDHLPRRADPVQPERELGPAGDRTALLLADVVRPAAAVDALAAGQRRQGQERRGRSCRSGTSGWSRPP